MYPTPPSSCHPSPRRWLIFGVLLAALLSACSDSDATAAMPSGDHVHALQEVADGTLLLGLHGALYRSEDTGSSWELAGLEGQDAMSLGAADPDGLLFVAGHGVLQRSRDGGATFEPLAPADLPSLDIHAFAQSASQPETVYAYVVGAGIFASTDAGETWQLRAPVGEAVGPDTGALLVARDDPEVLLVGGGQSGLLRSTDGGQTFEPVHDAGIIALAADPTDDDRILALTTEGVEESLDRGQTWTLLSRPELPGQPVTLAAGADNRVWLVTEQPRALHRSSDGGATWQSVQ